MKTTSIITTTLILTLTTTALVVADDYDRSPQPVPSPSSYQHHASTAYEGWLRGRADLRRAAGEYNYNSALANMYNQEAYRRYLENRTKKVETYFQMRALNQEARNAERRRRPTREAISRNARRAAPARLASYQFQPLLGTVVWPAVLRDREFQETRESVDQLIAARTIGNSGKGSENHRKVRNLTLRMKGQLKDQIDTMKPMEYVQAKKFLTSLEYEVSHKIKASGLAVN
jgi:hypothetical protein